MSAWTTFFCKQNSSIFVQIYVISSEKDLHNAIKSAIAVHCWTLFEPLTHFEPFDASDVLPKSYIPPHWNNSLNN